jgi:hypothetical protein
MRYGKRLPVVCAVWLALALPVAGQAGEPDDGAVEVTFNGTLADDGEPVRCRPVELLSEGFELFYSTPDGEGRGDAYAMRLRPGQLLVVEVGKSEDAPARTFLWRFDGRPKQPLEFDVTGPALLLNGNVVSIDLAREGAEPWLGSHGDVELSRIGCVNLSGEEAMDRRFLQQAELRGSGLVLDLTAYGAELPAGVRDAILACDPRGLFVVSSPATAELMAGTQNLEHLGIDALPQGAVAKPERLRTLMVESLELGDAASQPSAKTVPAARPISLRGLRRYRNLRVLYLMTGDVRVDSFAPVAELPALRSFVTDGGLHGMDVSKGLGRVEILVVDHCSDIADLGWLARLTHLRRLMLLGLPEDVRRLDVLGELPHLQVVVLDNSLLEARGETIARIRQARPELRIEGFCLGSRWVLAVVGGGALLAAWLRRRRRRACRAA